MSVDRKLLAELLEEARRDEVGLWLIVAALRNELAIGDPAALRALTLHYVRELLESGEIVAGEYDGQGVAEWMLSVPEVLSRIEAEWDALGREPSIGDIAVFVTRGRNNPR